MSRQRGMTLVEVMIAFGMLMGLALGVAYMMTQIQKASMSGTAKATAQEIRRNLLAMLETDSAWFRTFNSETNKTFVCLRKHRNCNNPLVDEEKVGLPYMIYDTSSSVYFDGLNPQKGYTAGGIPCSKFPSRSCPFRPELTWKPLCAGEGPCLPEQIELSARVIYNPGADALPDQRMAYNPENYSFRMIKNLLPAGVLPQNSSDEQSAAPVSASAPVIAAPLNTGTVSQAQQAPSAAGTNTTTSASGLPDDLTHMVEQQHNVICNTVAPALRGQAPESVKQTMRNMGYSDDMYDSFMQILKNCK